MDVKLLGSKHSSLRKRMKEKQMNQLTKSKGSEGEKRGNEIKEGKENAKANSTHVLFSSSPDHSIPILPAVVSMEEEHVVPTTLEVHNDVHFSPEKSTSWKFDWQSSSLSAQEKLDEDFFSPSTPTQQLPQDTTLIGQDFCSTPSQDDNDDNSDDNFNNRFDPRFHTPKEYDLENYDPGSPYPAYGNQAVQDILQELGASFLNSSSLPEESSPQKEGPSSEFTSLPQVESEGIKLSSTFQEPCTDVNISSRQDHDSQEYISSCEDLDQQPVDSSLLQTSLTSEMSRSPSPNTNPEAWRAYQSRNASLADRNASLIKEIRFAEQTCVELSQNKDFLERDLKHIQGLLEDEFSTKVKLLDKLEKLAESNQALEQALEKERDQHDELRVELENERQMRTELQEALQLHAQNFESQDALHLQTLNDKFEAERKEKEEFQTALQQEITDKTHLRNSLEQAQQHIQHIEASKDESFIKWGNEKECLERRVEELEAQNAYLQRQHVVSIEEPEGCPPLRAETLSSPMGPNEIRMQHSGGGLQSAYTTLQKEFNDYKEKEKERFDTYRKTLTESQLHFGVHLDNQNRGNNRLHGEMENNRKRSADVLTSQEKETLEKEVRNLNEELVVQRQWTETLQQTVAELHSQLNQRDFTEIDMGNVTDNSHHIEEMLFQRTAASQVEDSMDRDMDVLQNHLFQQRQIVIDLETKNENLQKQYDRILLSEESLRKSLFDVKERLLQVEFERDTAQRQVINIRVDAENWRRVETERIQNDVADRLNDASEVIACHADDVESKLWREIDSYRERVIHLTDMIELLKSNLDFDVSETDSAETTKIAEGQCTDATVLNATIRRQGPTDESLLQEMEEARLSPREECDDAGVLYLSEISHDNSTCSWMKTLDVSRLDDSAIIEVHKLQSSLAAARDQLESHKAALQTMEEEIKEHERLRQADSTKLHDFENLLESRNVKITELQIKLKSFERTLESMHLLEIELKAEKENVLNLKRELLNAEAEVENLSTQIHSSERSIHFSETLHQDTNMERLNEVVDLHRVLDSQKTTIAELRTELNQANFELQDLKTIFARKDVALEKLQSESISNDNGMTRLLQEITSLQQKLNAAESEVTHSNINFAKHEATEEELRLQLEYQIREIDHLKTEIVQKQQQNEQLRFDYETRIANKEKQFEHLQANLMSEIALKEQQSNQIKTKEIAEERSCQYIDELQREMQDAKMEIDNLRVAYVTCNERLAAAYEALNTNEDLIGKFKESSDEAVQMSIEVAKSARSDNVQLTSKLAALEIELQKCKGTLSHLEYEKSKYESVNLELQSNLDEKTNTLMKTTQQRDDAWENIRDIELKLKSISAERDAINQELESAMNIRIDLERKIRNVNQVENSKNNLSKKLEETFSSLVKTQEERDSLFLEQKFSKQKIEDAERQMSFMSKELEKVRSYYDEARQQHANLAAHMNATSLKTSQVIQGLEEKLRVSNVEMQNKRQIIIELNEKMTALTCEKEKDESIILDLKRSLKEAESLNIQKKYESTLKELNQLQEELAHTSNAHALCQKESNELRTQMEEIQRENQSLQEKTSKAESRLERAGVEFSAYKRCMEERIAERQEVLCEVQAFSESKQRELQDEINAIKKAKQDVISEISSALENFTSEFMESNDDLNVSFDGHATWQESLHCVKLFVSTLLENEREKTDEVQSKYIEVNSELQRLASELVNTCKDLHEARNAIDTLQRAVTEKAEIANRYLLEREDAYSKVVYLTGRLEMANRNQISGIGEADTFLREQRTLASQLQGRVDQLEQKNAKLRDYIRKLTSKCEQWQQSWEQQLRVTLDPRN